jgi:DNA polymerase-3 subunit alpha
MVGLVVGMRTMKNKRGEDMAFVTLDDRTARIEVLLFAEVYRQSREFVVRDSILVVEGTVSIDDFSGGLRVRANEVYTLTAARERYARELVLHLDESQFAPDFATVLGRLLGGSGPVTARARGGCPVRVVYTGGGARAEISLGTVWRVPPSDEVIGRLRERFGVPNVQLRYAS